MSDLQFAAVKFSKKCTEAECKTNFLYFKCLVENREQFQVGNNLFVSYDLMARGQDYERITDLIKQLGPWAKVQKSLWYVNSRMNAEEAGKFLRSAIDGNDQLIVIDASGNNAYWYSTDSDVTRHMMEQWYK